MTSGKTLSRYCAILLLPLAWVVQQALADSKNNTIEEVVVTAEKRQSNVEDTPLAISAFDQAQLQKKGINNATALQYYVPGLTFGKTVTRTSQVTIRGIGSENINPGGDPGVAVNVDGAYQQSTAYIGQDFFDIKRIEVLRGPQGTLYGRNATGGSINIITNKPTRDFEAKVRVGVGNYKNKTLEAVVSGPFSDAVRGRLAIDREKRDGYTLNVYNGSRIDNKDYTAVRGQLAADVTDNLKMNLSVESYHDNSTGVPLAVISPFPTQPLLAGLNLLTFAPVFWTPYVTNNALPNITLQDRRKVRENTPTTGYERSKGLIAHVDYDLGGVKLKSITGFSDMNYNNDGDTDGSAAVTTYQSTSGRYKTLTQELVLTSNNTGPWQWTSGLYYYREDSGFHFNIVLQDTTPLPTPFVGVPVTFETGGDIYATSYAAYGQTTYSLTDEWSVTAGLRYTRDDKSMHEFVLAPAFFLVDPTTGGPITNQDKRSWNKTTAKLGVQYRPNASMMWYASVSTGYKAGGFNVGGLQSSYNPETVTAYQTGLKTMLADNRVQLNLSAFDYDYRDMQVFQIQSVQAVIANAAKARIYGLEAETEALLTDSFSVDATFSYLNATYKSFSSIDPVDPAAGLQDLAGKTLPRAPKLSVNLGLNYSRDLSSGGSLTARLDYSWTGKQYFRPYNLLRDEQPAYPKTDLSLMWRSSDDRWQAEAYVHNLENKNTISDIVVAAAALGSTPLASFNPPRTFGVTVSRNW